MAFNPENLEFVDLCKAVTAVINTGAATVVGTLAYAQLFPLCSFPFGSELAAFCGALVTGVVTLGLNYFVLHSEDAKKIWNYIQSLRPHMGVLTKFKEINAELDSYLSEFVRLKFNLDTQELDAFSADLSACNSELERSLVLRTEVEKRGIELPFEMGKPETTRKWLLSLAKT